MALFSIIQIHLKSNRENSRICSWGYIVITSMSQHIFTCNLILFQPTVPDPLPTLVKNFTLKMKPWEAIRWHYMITNLHISSKPTIIAQIWFAPPAIKSTFWIQWATQKPISDDYMQVSVCQTSKTKTKTPQILCGSGRTNRATLACSQRPEHQSPKHLGAA